MVEERLMIVFFFDLSQKTIRLVDSCEKIERSRYIKLKIKRPVPVPKCQFSPASTSLIQPLLEPLKYLHEKPLAGISSQPVDANQPKLNGLYNGPD